MLKANTLLFLILMLSGCVTYSSLNAPRHQYADVQNGEIEYYRFGKGTPIVLIAGYGTDISSWNNAFLAPLAAQHDVIVFNNRNVGGSHVYSHHFLSRDLANDTYQLIQDLHLKNPAVLGISMGGMIAQQVAVMYPHTVSKLILINTAIAGNHSVRPSEEVQDKILNMPPSEIGRYNLAVNMFFSPSESNLASFNLVFDRFQPPYYQRINICAVRCEQQALVLDWADDNATAKKLESLPMPVLILNGLADQVIPPINSVILAKNIPHSTLKRWRNGGHAMIYQYPTAMANIINHFLKG